MRRVNGRTGMASISGHFVMQRAWASTIGSTWCGLEFSGSCLPLASCRGARILPSPGIVQRGTDGARPLPLCRGARMVPVSWHCAEGHRCSLSLASCRGTRMVPFPWHRAEGLDQKQLVTSWRCCPERRPSLPAFPVFVWQM